MTHGYVRSDQKEALLKRLKRIEGQVRGLQNMIETVQTSSLLIAAPFETDRRATGARHHAHVDPYAIPR